MGLFRRHGHPTTAAPDETEVGAAPVPRYQVLQCAGCARRMAPYVYMSNGKDYCLPCARQVAFVMRLVPAGKRADDVTNLDP